MTEQTSTLGIDAVFSELENELVNKTAPSAIDQDTGIPDDQDALKQDVNDGSVIDADLPYAQLEDMVEVPGMEGMSLDDPAYSKVLADICGGEVVLVSRAMGMSAGLEALSNTIRDRGIISRADIEYAISIYSPIATDLPDPRRFTSTPTKTNFKAGLEGMEGSSKALGALGAAAIVGVILKILSVIYRRVSGRAVMGKEDFAKMIRTPKDFARMCDQYDKKCEEYAAIAQFNPTGYKEAIADEVKESLKIDGFTTSNLSKIDNVIVDAFFKNEMTKTYFALYDLIAGKQIGNSDVDLAKLHELINEYPVYLESIVQLNIKTFDKLSKDYGEDGKLSASNYAVSLKDSSLAIPKMLKSSENGLKVANEWLSALTAKLPSATISPVQKYMEGFVDPVGLKKVEDLSKSVGVLAKKAEALKAQVQKNDKMDSEDRSNRVSILTSFVLELTDLQKSIFSLIALRDAIIFLGKQVKASYDSALKIYYVANMAAKRST